MRISDWSSDVCSSDLLEVRLDDDAQAVPAGQRRVRPRGFEHVQRQFQAVGFLGVDGHADAVLLRALGEIEYPRGQFGQDPFALGVLVARVQRSEEHTSELQSLMRISYAVFCLKKKKAHTLNTKWQQNND